MIKYIYSKLKTSKVLFSLSLLINTLGILSLFIIFSTNRNGLEISNRLSMGNSSHRFYFQVPYNEQVNKILTTLSERVTTRISLHEKDIELVSYKDGVDYEYFITNGRFFTEYELKNGDKKAVIGHNLLKKLSFKGDPIGEKIEILGEHYEIIGVLGNSKSKELDIYKTYLPINSMKNFSLLLDNPSEIEFSIYSNNSPPLKEKEWVTEELTKAVGGENIIQSIKNEESEMVFSKKLIILLSTTIIIIVVFISLKITLFNFTTRIKDYKNFLMLGYNNNYIYKITCLECICNIFLSFFIATWLYYLLNPSLTMILNKFEYFPDLYLTIIDFVYIGLISSISSILMIALVIYSLSKKQIKDI